MADCNFFSHDDYFLALQMASGCRDKDTQKKLLAEMTVDLPKFVATMEGDESANDNAAAIRGEVSAKRQALSITQTAEKTDHHWQLQRSKSATAVASLVIDSGKASAQLPR